MKGVACLQLLWKHQHLPWIVIQGPRESCPLQMKVFSLAYPGLLLKTLTQMKGMPATPLCSSYVVKG